MILLGRIWLAQVLEFYELSKVLSRFCDVTLATPNKIDIETPTFKSFTYEMGNYKSIQKAVESSEIILIQVYFILFPIS